MNKEKETFQSEKDFAEKDFENNEKLDMSELEDVEGGIDGTGCSAPLSGGCSSGSQSIKKEE